MDEFMVFYEFDVVGEEEKKSHVLVSSMLSFFTFFNFRNTCVAFIFIFNSKNT